VSKPLVNVSKTSRETAVSSGQRAAAASRVSRVAALSSLNAGCALGLTFRSALPLAILLRLRWRCGHRLLPQVLNDTVPGPVGEPVEAVTNWNLPGEEVAEVHHPVARPTDKDESRHVMIVPARPRWSVMRSAAGARHCEDTAKSQVRVSNYSWVLTAWLQVRSVPQPRNWCQHGSGAGAGSRMGGPVVESGEPTSNGRGRCRAGRTWPPQAGGHLSADPQEGLSVSGIEALE